MSAFVNVAMPAEWTQSLGECTELLADKYGITRVAQDGFAAVSHRQAAAAWDAGVYTAGDRPEVVIVPGTALLRDESVRPDTTVERLAALKPAFRPDGSRTAGNASPLNDGAAALLLGGDDAGQRLGLPPLARVVSRGVAAVDPRDVGIGPVLASAMALEQASIGVADLARVELNEAFAAQSLACLAEWPDLDPGVVNTDGGAVALGHPLGASGARVLGHLARQLHDLALGAPAGSGPVRGLAAICIGVGQGLAVVLESV